MSKLAECSDCGRVYNADIQSECPECAARDDDDSDGGAATRLIADGGQLQSTDRVAAVLRDTIDGESYVKARHLSSEIQEMSTTAVGRCLAELADGDPDGLTVERWGQSSGVTWRVRVVAADGGIPLIHEWARDWHEAHQRGDDDPKRETDASAGWRAEYHHQHVEPDVTDR